MAQLVRAPCLYKACDREITKPCSCYAEVAGSSPAGSIFLLFKKRIFKYFLSFYFNIINLLKNKMLIYNL